MPKTIEQFVKENGGTDEDVKLFTSNAKMKAAVEAQILAAETAAAEAATAKQKVTDYDKWYQETALPTVANKTKEADSLAADLAAERARVAELTKRGLAAVAGGEGDPDAEAKAAAAAAAAAKGKGADFDASKFVDRDSFQQAFYSAGDAIALSNDVAAEHRDLFGTRLNVRELLKEARDAKVPFDQFWEKKFNVVAKRAEIAAAAEAERVKKIKEEAIAEYKAAESNPLTKTPAASMFPGFKKEGDTAANSPWLSPDERAAQRVQKGLASLNKTQ